MKSFFTTLIITGIIAVAPVAVSAQETIPGCTDQQCNINSTGNDNNMDVFNNLGGSWQTTQQPATGTAGQTNACSPLTATNFDGCCKTYTIGRADFSACSDYLLKNMPGQVGSGSGSGTTGPVNGGVTSASYNTNTSSMAYDSTILACRDIKFKSLLDILIWIKCIITAAIIPLLFTFALLYFMWKVLQFMRASDKADKEDAKRGVYWGVIGLFVMVTIWGIIAILSNTLGIEAGIPTLETKDSYLQVQKASGTGGLGTSCMMQDGTWGTLTASGCKK